MIIKAMFKRHERWNPVHPTYGAFWGMGIGVGCGVGWGPGFGPDVIGYVGAGCGVGFSVGFTVAGVGVGLPANYLFGAPYNAFIAAVPQISGLQREVSIRLSSFKQKFLLEEGISSFDAKSLIPGHSRSIRTSLGEFHGRLFRDDKGPKD